MKVVKIDALTFLRFIAAFIVVIFHYGRGTGLASIATPLFVSGPEMVTFFFVLSGFVLMIAYYAENKPMKSYFLARIARIVPIYLLALLAICYFSYSKKGIDDYTALILNMTFLQSWFPPYALSLNTPAWSLSVEAFFYLTFPVILFIIKSTKVDPRKFLFIMFAVWLCTQAILTNLLNSRFYLGAQTESHNLIFHFPLSHYCSFLLGVAGGYTFIRTQRLHENGGRLAFGLLVAAFALAFFVLQNPGVYTAWLGFAVPTGASFYAPMFLFLVLCIAYSRNIITKFLSLPVFVVLGEASYSLYILQKPVQTAYVKYIKERLDLTQENHFYAYLAILIGLSILSLYLIEKPARKLILTLAPVLEDGKPGKLVRRFLQLSPRLALPQTMRTSDFDYDLPPESIAQTPAEPRDSSRLLVVQRATGQLEHRFFRDVGEYLRPGDLLVLNQTRVIPARIFARKPTGGRVELLLLRRADTHTWEALVGGKGLTGGKTLTVEDGPRVEILEVLEGSRRRIRFETPIEPFFPKAGHIPLPPYIRTELKDPERYQTVYAHDPGSAAAPTAGLHFTPQLLDGLQAGGVKLAYVTLHVGLDTFAPVTEADPAEHRIHSEWCELPPETADAINSARQSGGRIIAVGTTSVRTLESAAQQSSIENRKYPRSGTMSKIAPFTGDTSLFILPGYEYRIVDAMITNFHLPKSTLLMLVSAFAGRETVLNAYHVAIREGYRFFSFGDAMLIL